MRLLRLFIALSLVALDASPAPAAPNNLQMLYTACPNGGALRAINAANAKKAGYDDAFQQRAAREIAEQFYHCSLTARNPYAQDWAQFYCMQNVWFSLRTPEQMRITGPSLIYLSDVLAGYSKYPDVRTAAHELRALVAHVRAGLR